MTDDVRNRLKASGGGPSPKGFPPSAPTDDVLGLTTESRRTATGKPGHAGGNPEPSRPNDEVPPVTGQEPRVPPEPRRYNSHNIYPDWTCPWTWQGLRCARPRAHTTPHHIAGEQPQFDAILEKAKRDAEAQRDPSALDRASVDEVADSLIDAFVEGTFVGKDDAQTYDQTRHAVYELIRKIEREQGAQRDRLRAALDQALDRMESAFNRLTPRLTPGAKEAIAMDLCFGTEELRAALSDPTREKP